MSTGAPGGTTRLSFDGGPTYEWSEPWKAWLTSRPASEQLAWLHSGIAVTRSGDVVVVSHDRAQAHLLGADGSVGETFDTGVTQGHGLQIVEDDGVEVIWIADNGSRRHRESDGSYPNVASSKPPRAAKMTLAGEHLLSIPAPDLEIYRSGRYCPTSVAVDETSFGGNGDIWVADGYGASYVHQFRKDGSYVMSLSGDEGAGRFDCPHAIWIDRRKGSAELYVSDRRNHRLQVFGLDGAYRRVVGDSSVFRRPGGFATDGRHLFVAELDGRLAVLGPDDRLAGYLGSNRDAAARPGFPNELNSLGLPVRPSDLRPGYFNSPHGITADDAGNLYINEWLIGGRLVKLIRHW